MVLNRNEERILQHERQKFVRHPHFLSHSGPSNKSLHTASLIGAIVRAYDHASDDETLGYSISLLLREFKNLSYPDGFLVRGLYRANTARNDEMFLAIGSFSAVVKNLG